MANRLSHATTKSTVFAVNKDEWGFLKFCNNFFESILGRSENLTDTIPLLSGKFEAVLLDAVISWATPKLSYLMVFCILFGHFV